MAEAPDQVRHDKHVITTFQRTSPKCLFVQKYHASVNIPDGREESRMCRDFIIFDADLDRFDGISQKIHSFILQWNH